MRRECRERFSRHQIQRESLISDPGMHYGTCRDACRDRQTAVAGKTFPAFPAYAQPAILRIWQEAHQIVKMDNTGPYRLPKTQSPICTV